MEVRLLAMNNFPKKLHHKYSIDSRYVSVGVNEKLYLVFIFTYMDWSQEYAGTFPYPNKHLRVQSQLKKRTRKKWEICSKFRC